MTFKDQFGLATVTILSIAAINSSATPAFAGWNPLKGNIKSIELVTETFDLSDYTSNAGPIPLEETYLANLQILHPDCRYAICLPGWYWTEYVSGGPECCTGFHVESLTLSFSE